MTFIDLPRNEMIAFAYKKKHPFYLKYVNASESEKAKIQEIWNFLKTVNYETPYGPFSKMLAFTNMPQFL